MFADTTSCLLQNRKSYKIIPSIDKKLLLQIRRTKKIDRNGTFDNGITYQIVIDLISRLSKIPTASSLDLPGLLRTAISIGKYHSNYYDSNNNSSNSSNNDDFSDNDNNNVDQIYTGTTMNNENRNSLKNCQIYVDRKKEDIAIVTSLWKAVLTLHDSLVTGTKTPYPHLLLESLKSLVWLTQTVPLNPDKKKAKNINNSNYSNGKTQVQNKNLEAKGGEIEEEEEDDEDDYQWLALSDRIKRAIPLLRLSKGQGLGQGLEKENDDMNVLTHSLVRAVFERSSHPSRTTTQIRNIPHKFSPIRAATNTTPNSKLSINEDQEQNYREKYNECMTDVENILVLHYSKFCMNLLIMTGQEMIKCCPSIVSVNMLQNIWSFVGQFIIPLDTVGYTSSTSNKIEYAINNDYGSERERERKKNDILNDKKEIMNKENSVSNLFKLSHGIDNGNNANVNNTESRTGGRNLESSPPSLLDLSYPSPAKSVPSSSHFNMNMGMNDFTNRNNNDITFNSTVPFPSHAVGGPEEQKVGLKMVSKLGPEVAIHNILRSSLLWAIDLGLSNCYTIRTYDRTNNTGRPTLAAHMERESMAAMRILKQHALWHLADNVSKKNRKIVK